MQSFPLLVLASCLSVIAACGGGGAKPAPDAQETLGGLGQSCTTPADCPANARNCIIYADGATQGICSPTCLTNGTMMTNATGGVATISPNPAMAPQSTICQSSYTQGTDMGSPSCETFVEWAPMDRPVFANKTYTAVKLVCAIVCVAGQSCPAPLHCDTDREWCVP